MCRASRRAATWAPVGWFALAVGPATGCGPEPVAPELVAVRKVAPLVIEVEFDRPLALPRDFEPTDLRLSAIWPGAPGQADVLFDWSFHFREDDAIFRELVGLDGAPRPPLPGSARHGLLAWDVIEVASDRPATLRLFADQPLDHGELCWALARYPALQAHLHHAPWLPATALRGRDGALVAGWSEGWIRAGFIASVPGASDELDARTRVESACP